MRQKTARRIKYPLFMKDNIPVRTIEELKEHFDMGSVLSYAFSGEAEDGTLKNSKLTDWLHLRYYDELEKQIAALSVDDSELDRKLCEIFEVPYLQTVNPIEIRKRLKKLELVKAQTDRQEILDHVDFVAPDQEELYRLLLSDAPTIYLIDTENCGFVITKERLRDVRFVGVHDTKITFIGITRYYLEKYKLSFENVVFEFDYSQRHLPNHPELIGHEESVAINQEELDMLLRRKDVPVIYLYDSAQTGFVIRRDQLREVQLKGVNQPHVCFTSVTRYILNAFAVMLHNIQAEMEQPGSADYVGITISLGKYCKTDLQWRIVDYDDDGFLLISETPRRLSFFIVGIPGYRVLCSPVSAIGEQIKDNLTDFWESTSLKNDITLPQKDSRLRERFTYGGLVTIIAQEEYEKYGYSIESNVICDRMELKAGESEMTHWLPVIYVHKKHLMNVLGNQETELDSSTQNKQNTNQKTTKSTDVANRRQLTIGKYHGNSLQWLVIDSDEEGFLLVSASLIEFSKRIASPRPAFINPGYLAKLTLNELLMNDASRDYITLPSVQSHLRKIFSYGTKSILSFDEYSAYGIKIKENVFCRDSITPGRKYTGIYPVIYVQNDCYFKIAENS